MRFSILPFGQTLAGYSVPVVNERAVRAGAGLLFVGGLISFMHAWSLGNFAPTRVFIILFLIDFSLRLWVSPRYSPSLIIGQWFVRNQAPEYTGAAQKAFAWGIGYALAVLMFFLMVVNSVVGPINIVVCSVCLLLMFFETAFGICIGCKLYQWIYKDPAQLCPGESCTYIAPHGAAGTKSQWAVVAACVMVLAVVVKYLPQNQAVHAIGTPVDTSAPVEARCVVPEFAKAMGHEQIWKKHNNCL